MKTFDSGIKLHLPFLKWSFLGFNCFFDLNSGIKEYTFLGFIIKSSK